MWELYARAREKRFVMLVVGIGAGSTSLDAHPYSSGQTKMTVIVQYKIFVHVFMMIETALCASTSACIATEQKKKMCFRSTKQKYGIVNVDAILFGDT